uniref:Uncharacterized protein n=1 Tax=Arundo donax TaxID=35708 RepID=A0A0A9E2D9_ARUDO
MTARSDDPNVSPGTAAAAGSEIWGTWEELLIACAVRLHDTASWDSVAMKVQSRSTSAAAVRLMPSGCRLRFRLLHRRFAAENGDGGGGGDEDPATAATDRWVEELRKLRVAELRREVERYDLSIGETAGGEGEEHLRRGRAGGEEEGGRRGGSSGEGIARGR